jgi:hypothetical protein
MNGWLSDVYDRSLSSDVKWEDQKVHSPDGYSFKTDPQASTRGHVKTVLALSAT